MAYSDMNDFLKRYFRQMHINHMSPDVMARFQDSYTKGTLNEDQQDWIAKYFTVTPDGKLVRKELPEITDSELSDEQAKKLYIELCKTLAQMKGISHLYTLKDKDASDFLTRWFENETLADGTKAFSIPKANATTEDSIQKQFLPLFNGPEAVQIKQIILENAVKDDGTSKAFDDMYAINDFIDKCQNKKYNEDDKVQNKLKWAVKALRNYVLSNYEVDIPVVNKLKEGEIYQALENINSENAFDKIDVNDANIPEFRKNKLPVILKTLYENQTIRNKFKDKDQSKIVIDQLEKYTENKIDWQKSDSDNYVQPKLDDVKTPLEQLKKWAGDTYNDTLKKYEELRGAHLFSSPFAKEICKAIDKEKVKPVDGLKGLLEKKDAIKKRLENKNVEGHFDWFTQTMEDLQNKIPDAVEGCWNNAKQMQCVIQNIILKATDPRTATEDDFEKAKTAMEIMTVMKYGMMTSKVMDAMRQADFKVFSDGELSWNKNEGIQFITKAFDKSVKAAFLGVGYAVTFARNKIMMRNMNFTDANNKSGPLADRLKELNRKKADDDATKATMEAENERDKNSERDNQDIVDSLEAGYEGNKQLKEAQEEKINKIDEEIAEKNQALQKLEEEKETLEQEFQELEQYKQNYDSAEDILANGDLDREKEKLDKRKFQNDMVIGAKKTELMADPLLDPDGNPIVDEDLKEARKKQLAQEISQLYSEKTDIKSSLDQNMQDRNPATMSDERKAKRKEAEDAKHDFETNHKDKYDKTKTELDTRNTRIEKLKHEIESLHSKRDGLTKDKSYEAASDKVAKYDTAKQKIKELQDTRAKREQALSTWDDDHVNKVLYLENYWNMLNGGESKTWRLFTKNAQDDFDEQTNKDARLRRIMLNAQLGRVT